MRAARAALVVAALASIATSQAQDYVVVDRETLPPIEISAQVPLRRYSITAEVQGEKSQPCSALIVQVGQQARATSTEATQVRVTLQSTVLTGYVTSDTITLDQTGAGETTLSLSQWTDCFMPSCSLDELELTIELVSGDTIVDLTGTVELEARGGNDERPPSGAITSVRLLP